MRTTARSPLLPLAPGPARLALLALALGGFGLGTTEFATMGLLPEIAADLSASIPQTGFAITAYALGVVVGAPTLAAVGARLDRRTLLLWLLVAFTVANTASAFAPDLPTLVGARFLAGLPHGAFFGVGAVVGTAVVGPERRGHAVSMMMAGLTIACAVGVPATAVVGHAIGWRWSFVGVGGIGLVTLLAVRAWVPGLAAAAGASVRSELSALRNRALWIAFAAGAIGFGGMFAVYSYVKPLLMEASGLSVGVVPVVLALYGLGMTAGTLLGGRLADRSVLGTVVLGMVSTIVVLVAIALVGREPVPAVVAIVLLGVTSQVLGLSLQTRLMDVSPAAPSLGAALCHSALNLGNASGAFFGGLVIDAGLGYLAPAWVGAGLTAVGLLVVVTVGRGAAPAVHPGPQEHADAPHARVGVA